MQTNLCHTPLFLGIKEEELPAILRCLGGQERRYSRGEVILPEGVPITKLGVVRHGKVHMEHSDVWGNNSVLGHAASGAVFGEAYACAPEEPLLIRVIAAEETTVLFLDMQRIWNPCSDACPFHIQLLRNLLTISAKKNLQLSRRILHTGAKTIRGRLLSYFSDCSKRAGSRTFSIPYNRQQLADYLGVDRSAMCSELSKMQKDGILWYQKNQFRLETAEV